MSKKVIAIIGGIGSGKSVVSTILRTIGYGVYDCDSRAKVVMDNSREIKEALVAAFGVDAVDPDGVINRPYIAKIVFSDKEALQKLNGIVHPAVEADLRRWISNDTQRIVFVETAILRESGLDCLVDGVWHVTAPEEVRIERVMKRNNLPREAVEARIRSQKTEEGSSGLPKVKIINDDRHSVLPQVMRLLEGL